MGAGRVIESVSVDLAGSEGGAKPEAPVQKDFIMVYRKEVFPVWGPFLEHVS